MNKSLSRRHAMGWLAFGAAGLLSGRRVLARPLQAKDRTLTDDEVGVEHGQFVLGSTFGGSFPSYRLTNRLTNMSKQTVRIKYLSALLVDTIVPAQQTTEDTKTVFLRPVRFDVSWLPSMAGNVQIYEEPSGHLIAETNAPAYVPGERLIGFSVREVAKAIDYLVRHADKVAILATVFGKSPDVTFTSELRMTGADQYAYDYRISNKSPDKLHFEWASVVDPSTRRAWTDRVGEAEPSRPFNFYESGSPIVVNDIVAFNTIDLGRLPPLTNLKDDPRLAPRVADLARLPKDDPNSILIAPAFVPERWIKSRR